MRYVILMCAALTACGGGSDGTGTVTPTPTPVPTPTPTPTPSPTPTPTPTPAPAASFPLEDVTKTVTFETAFATTAFGDTLGVPAPDAAIVVDASSASTITLDSGQIDISVPIGNIRRPVWRAFDSNPGFYVPASATSYSAEWRNVLNLNSEVREIGRSYITTSDTISVLNTVFPGYVTNDPAYAYRYVSYAQWDRIFGAATRNDMLVFGFKTATAEIPTSGARSFGGIVRGFDRSLIGTSRETATPMGTAIFTADYGARTVTFTITVPLRSAATTGTTASVTLTGTGNYVAGINRLTGTVTGAGLSGRFTGSFFGPQAAEIGLAIAAQGVGTGTAVDHRFIASALGK